MQRNRYTVNCSIIFTEFPLLERAQVAADAGFSNVEFWWPFPDAAPSQAEIDAFVSSIEHAGVALTGLNLFPGDMSAGERGILSSLERGREFEENLPAVRQIVGALDCHVLNALYGNRIDGQDPDAQDAIARQRLRELAGFTAETSTTIVLEPLSGVDAYPLQFAADAIAVIDDVAASGATTDVKLLADLYHLAVNGEDVDELIRTRVPRVGHVQIADAPGRNEPGTGSLPIPAWLAALESAGYGGFLGLEYRPSSTSSASFSWLA